MTPDHLKLFDSGDQIMNDTTAILWMMLLIALRLGLPLLVVLVGGNLLNAWVERHQDRQAIS